MSVTTIRLQTDIEKQLDTLAAKLQRSKGWVINQALIEYLEKQQLAQERWQQTLEAMESAAQGKVVAGEEVHEWLNSWGSKDELEAPKAR